MAIFFITFVAILIGLILIALLKKTSPPPPQQTIHFENPDNKPLFLVDPEKFKEKCLDFLGKFNLEYRHSIWAEDNELEIDMQDETPVVGGKFLALCIIDPPNQIVTTIKVNGFLDTVKGEGAAKGILITTGYFQNDAAYVVEGEPVELVDVVTFVDYLKKFEIYE